MRLVILLNRDVKMTRGKAAAQAVHAALRLLDVHPACPVIVLGASRADDESCAVTIRDAGATEVAPGTLTAGAKWEDGAAASFPRFLRVLHAAFGPDPARPSKEPTP